MSYAEEQPREQRHDPINTPVPSRVQTQVALYIIRKSPSEREIKMIKECDVY
jgi:hypothetical protein